MCRCCVVAVLTVAALASFAAGQGERSLIQEAVIDAPVAEVWRLFSTDEGVQSWMAPRAKFDLRVGGELRTSYNAQSTLDDEHTIINRILSYLPQRMLAIRNTQVPLGFQHAEKFQQAWSVVSFEAVDAQRTRVRIAGLNYGTGPEWDQIYDHFDKGNAYLLGLLQDVAVRAAEGAAEKPTDAQEAAGVIRAEVTVNTTREQAWRAWTTNEGVREFFAPDTNIELRLGGPYELYFADGPEGKRGSETCKVLVYEDQRMLSVSWNAPPHLSFARQHHTWVVMEFVDAGPGQVRVTLTHLGYDELIEAHPDHAEEFEQTRAYFQRVWPHVLEAMKVRLEGAGIE